MVFSNLSLVVDPSLFFSGGSSHTLGLRRRLDLICNLSIRGLFDRINLGSSLSFGSSFGGLGHLFMFYVEDYQVTSFLLFSFGFLDLLYSSGHFFISHKPQGLCSGRFSFHSSLVSSNLFVNLNLFLINSSLFHLLYKKGIWNFGVKLYGYSSCYDCDSYESFFHFN